MSSAASPSRPRLLDLFCGGGGASMGYHQAGFDVVGVDIVPQPRYPFTFWQADALALMERGAMSLWDAGPFDAIHASPPCQAFSPLAKRWSENDYPDLITPLRPLLQAKGVPYIIENVVGAPLEWPVTLCGSMFLLGTEDYQLRRHRAFETSWLLLQPQCVHDARPVITVTGHAGRAGRNGTGSTAERREAMGITWLPSDELVEAVPPAYTKFIGNELLAEMRRKERLADRYDLRERADA